MDAGFSNAQSAEFCAKFADQFGGAAKEGVVDRLWIEQGTGEFAQLFRIKSAREKR